MLTAIGEQYQRVLCIEDGVRNGGMGSAVLEWMSDHGYAPRVVRLGLPDEFVPHATVGEQYHLLGIDKEGIRKEIEAMLSR